MGYYSWIWCFRYCSRSQKYWTPFFFNQILHGRPITEHRRRECGGSTFHIWFGLHAASGEAASFLQSRAVLCSSALLIGDLSVSPKYLYHQFDLYIENCIHFGRCFPRLYMFLMCEDRSFAARRCWLVICLSLPNTFTINAIHISKTASKSG